MQHASIERVLAAPNLPTLPAVAVRVLELTSQPEVSLRELASVIENDPAIASKVLRTVNSSFYGLSRKCGSIQQALAFLGMQTVKALVLGFSLARSIDGGGLDEVSFDFLDYWRRSIYSAAAARQIALLAKRCDPDEAFVAALVQDIGTVVMWRAFGDRYLQTLDVARGDHRRLCALEQRAFETDHGEVGAALLSRWQFPAHVVEAVRLHHRSHDASVSDMDFTRTCELSSTVARILSPRGGDAEIARYRRDGQDWFDLRPGPLMVTLQKIADLADELSRAFGLETGSAADVDAILKRAAQIRGEQRLAAPDVDGGDPDTVDHASISFTDIPDARMFGIDLEREFLRQERRGGTGLVLIGIDRARELQQAFTARGVESAMNHALHVATEVLGRTEGFYRFVGAEIMVMMRETEVDELCRVAELIRRRIAESPVELDHSSARSFPITASVGAAIHEPSSAMRGGGSIETPDQLVRAAMFALASSRRTRNRVTLFHRGLDASAA